MSLSLDFYTNKKNQLLDQLLKLQSVFQEMGNRTDTKRVEEIKKQIEMNHFQVVVVGEFSRGKSTFINALLGRKLLPSSAKPTTTLLNMITYSKEPFIKLHFRNKKITPINEAIFQKLVAPKDPIAGDKKSEQEYEKNVELFKSIEYAEIGHPLNFCEDGVQIIDTPGTNDLDPTREKLTNSIIPQSDVAILLLSATKILSESELSFLKDRILASDIQKIFIVINQLDLLKTEEDVNKVYDHAYLHLKDILKEPKIFMVSSKGALNARRQANGEELISKRGKPIRVLPIEQSGFPQLEKALGNFLQYERGMVKLSKPLKQMDKLITSVLEKNIELERRALNLEMDGLQEKLLAFRPRIESIRREGYESLQKIAMNLKLEEAFAKKWYQGELAAITAKGLETFEEFRYCAVEEISGKVEKAIAPLERSLHEEKKKKVADIAKKVIYETSQQLNIAWFKLEADVQNLGLINETSNELAEAKISFDTEDEFSALDYIFDGIFETLDSAWEKSDSFIGKIAIGAVGIATSVVGIASYLFGSAWALLTGMDEKAELQQKLIKQFNTTETERQKHFIAEWDGMVKAIRKQYQEIVNENVQQVEDQLNQLLENTQLEEKEIKLKLELLNERCVALMQVKKELSNLNLDFHALEEKVGV